MKAAVLELPRPRLEHFRASIGALLLIGWTFFAYDLSVLDLQSTKRAALITGASVWGLFALIRGLREPEKRIPFGVPLLILVWAVLPAVATGAPIVQTLGKPIYLAFLALSWALIHRTVAHREGVAGLLWGLTGLALVVAGSAIVEVLWLGGDPAFSGAPVVTFGNPNHLGAALVLLMPPVLACLESRTFRIGVLVIAVLTMFAIGLSGSYLALMGGSAVLGIAAAGPTHPVRRRIVIVALLMLSLAGGFVAQSVRATPASEFTTAAAEDTTPVSPTPVSPTPEGSGPVSPTSANTTTDSSAGSGFGRALKGRLYLVERGAEVVARAPLTGVGVGEYAWGFAIVQADHLEANPEDG